MKPPSVPPTPLNNFKIIGKTTCHANNNFPTLLEGLPVKKSFGSYLGSKTVINNFGVALHYTVRLQRGSCIYVFEVSFCQICRILGYGRKAIFLSYITKMVNFQPPIFCPFSLSYFFSFLFYWKSTKIALNKKCELCHRPGQCFGQKIDWWQQYFFELEICFQLIV